MTTLRNPVSWMLDWFKGDDRDVRVTSDSMLGSAAIWYAINTIAGDVAKMPLDRRRRTADGRGSDPDTRDVSYRLLREEPNSFQTADVFKEQIQGHALGWGNGRAAIIRTGGRPVEFIPMQPDRSCTVMVEGEKYHATKPHEDDPIKFVQAMQEAIIEESIPDDVVVLHDRDVLHIPGFGWDGFSGLSIASVAKDSIGIDLRSQRFANKGMKKGFAGQMMLEAPPGLFRDEDDAKKFLEGFRKRHENAEDAETVGLLREGITANVLNMSNKDAEFLDQRRFSRQDVMLWFGLQHIPGDDSSVSYNSLEQKQLAYLASCLDRWLVRWEMQCNCKLRTESEKRLDRVYYKFNRGTWLRTDMQTTQTVLSGFVQSEILSQNEARAKLDLNPVEGGDEYRNPAINTTDSNDSSDVENAVEYFVGVEAARLIDATANDDFIGWVDSFYAKWAITIVNKFGGLPTKRINELTNGHKEQILEAAGSAFNVEELKQNVTKVTEGWK